MMQRNKLLTIAAALAASLAIGSASLAQENDAQLQSIHDKVHNLIVQLSRVGGESDAGHKQAALNDLRAAETQLDLAIRFDKSHEEKRTTQKRTTQPRTTQPRTTEERTGEPTPTPTPY